MLGATWISPVVLGDMDVPSALQKIFVTFNLLKVKNAYITSTSQLSKMIA
jgi:hypothetical protein